MLKLALEVTHGSYPLAVLTAHNLLKDIAIEGRDAIYNSNHGAGPAVAPSLLADLQDAAHFVGKLQSLRADPASSRDKIGPWYHTFAVLTAGALAAPGAALAVVQAEHGGKTLNFFSGEGGFNSEKYQLDRLTASIAKVKAIAHLSEYRPQP